MSPRGSGGAVAAIMLAAGKGTRMRSTLPKVLHPLAGRPMVSWIAAALSAAGVAPLCAVLSEDLTGFDLFLDQHPEIAVAIQKNRLGTGDAVAAAAYAFSGVKMAPFAAGRLHQGTPIAAPHVLIAPGDTPAIETSTITAFIEKSRARKAQVAVLGMRVPDPKGYGRMIIADDGSLTQIVEEKDASPEQRLITACNTGVIFAETDVLFELVAGLMPNNAQREYYLTDIVAGARAKNLATYAHVVDDFESFAGVNDRVQLSGLEETLLARKRAELMRAGVTIHSPATVYVEHGVDIFSDAEIGAGAVLKGRTTIGGGAVIGPNAVIEDATIGPGASIGAGSVVARVIIAAGEVVPPLTVRLA